MGNRIELKSDGASRFWLLKHAVTGRGRWFTALVLVAVAVTTFAIYFHKILLPNFKVVQSDVLYRSGQPRELGLRVMDWLGIRTCLNLRSRKSKIVRDEIAFCSEHGIRYVVLPVTPQSSMQEVVDRFLELMDDPSNYPVLVHCARGRDRTGVLAAVYRMEFNAWTNERALSEMYALGFERGAMSGPAGEKFVKSYVPRATGNTPPPLPEIGTISSQK